MIYNIYTIYSSVIITSIYILTVQWFFGCVVFVVVVVVLTLSPLAIKKQQSSIADNLSNDFAHSVLIRYKIELSI